MEATYPIPKSMIEQFRQALIAQEKSRNTLEKYIRDVTAFYRFLPRGADGEAFVNKRLLMQYKETLQLGYKLASINSMLTAINGFLKFLHYGECCVRLIKCQRRIFSSEERELSKDEYISLLKAAQARGQERLMFLMETICSTGIRVSELQYITVDAVRRGRVEISSKGKRRIVFLAESLQKHLSAYAQSVGRRHGCVFQSKNGKPLDRSNIWKDMKALCKHAGVPESKVFPHNLRHLFARTFYGIEKDIVRLADVLGHSSVETSRIYTISSGQDCARQIGLLGLVLDLTYKYTT